MRLSLLPLLASLTMLLFSNAAKADSEGLVFVELFTSQGCTACPFADNIFKEIVGLPNVLAVGCNVTYWNRDGWEDTFALETCTKRQHAYRKSLQTKNLYTPQIVVNGIAEAPGVIRGKILKMIDEARKTPLPVIPLSVESAEILKADLSGFTDQKFRKGKLVVMAYDALRTENVSGGRNKGKALSYANSALFQHDGGPWNGAPLVLLKPLPKANHYAVILQDIETGQVLAAGSLATGSL